MTKLYSATMLFLLTASAFSAEWGVVKSVVGGNSIEIVAPEKRITLIWPSRIVPGEDLLLIKSTYPSFQEAFFRTYNFAGVVGSSIQINVTGSHKEKGASAALRSKSMEKTLFVERANDGIFYFVPEDIKGDGVIKIQRNPAEPGFYSVALSRQSQ